MAKRMSVGIKEVQAKVWVLGFAKGEEVCEGEGAGGGEKRKGEEKRVWDTKKSKEWRDDNS